MSEKYNGWTNWETWLVGLWFNDSFDGEQDWVRHLTDDDYKEWVLSYLEGQHPLEGFMSDVMDGFLGTVNWSELADHVREGAEA